MQGYCSVYFGSIRFEFLKSMDNNKIAKGMLFIMAANIANMAISIMTNLVLPKKLSIEAYAAIKTYQLYLTYVGILHFGVVDGVYLKYGGKNIKEIDERSILLNLSTFRLFQIAVMILGTVISLIICNPILLIVSLMILPANMQSFYKYLYQACGEFKKYSIIIYALTASIFIINMTLVFFLHSDEYILYLLGYLVVNIMVWLAIEINFNKQIMKGETAAKGVDIGEMISFMKSGIFLTLGNFASKIVTSMDRWFVKILIGTGPFAQYAFAVSLENFLNTAATPVSITFYNALCNDDSRDNVRKLREAAVVFSSVLISAAFPAKYIITIYLDKYIGSIHVLFFLFGAQLFHSIIRSIYVNLYKARKQQRKYLRKLLLSLFIGLVLNIIGYFVMNIKESYAIATFFSAIIWLCIVQADFKEERLEWKEIIYIAISCGLFFSLEMIAGPVQGFVLYIFGTALASYVLFRDLVISVCRFCNKEIKKVYGMFC